MCEVQWRERGNKRVDGYLVEYFANPIQKVRQEISENYRAGVMVLYTMLENALVLFDQDGVFETLRRECREQFCYGLPTLTQDEQNMRLYYIWNDFDELTRAYHNATPDFKMLYYHFGINIMYTYSNCIRSPHILY